MKSRNQKENQTTYFDAVFMQTHEAMKKAGAFGEGCLCGDQYGVVTAAVSAVRRYDKKVKIKK